MTRLVHGLGQVGFGPNLDSTHRRWVEELETDRWNQLVELVSGEGSVGRFGRSLEIKKSLRNLQKTSSKSGKIFQNLEKVVE